MRGGVLLFSGLLLSFACLGCGDSVQTVAVAPADARLVVADTVRLTATVLTADGKVLTDRTVTWESQDPGIATVSVDGLVTGAADGVADVVATADGVAGSAQINVFTPAVLVLSNYGSGNAGIKDSLPAHEAHFTIDTMNVSSQTPTVAALRQYDVVLLYEDGLFANSVNVGDSVGAYFQAGGNVVLGTFYWQDRSDNPEYTTHGWGTLETVDPFLAPYGAEYRPDSLDAASVVAHPMTAGVTALTVDSYHGGVEAKTGTTVLARWHDECQTCSAGVNAPLLGYRIGSNGQRMVGVSVAPHYPVVGSGDFYRLWGNVLRWAAAGGPGPSVSRTAWAAGRAGQAAPAAAPVVGGSRGRR